MVCGHCKLERDSADYGIRDRRTGRIHTICIGCRRGYSRAHHHRDRASFNARRRARMAGYRARNRAFIEDYFLAHPCVDCGLIDPIVMEFDHVLPGKLTDVSTMVRDGSPIAKKFDAKLPSASSAVRTAIDERRRGSSGAGQEFIRA